MQDNALGTKVEAPLGKRRVIFLLAEFDAETLHNLDIWMIVLARAREVVLSLNHAFPLVG